MYKLHEPSIRNKVNPEECQIMKHKAKYHLHLDIIKIYNLNKMYKLHEPSIRNKVIPEECQIMNSALVSALFFLWGVCSGASLI